MKKTIDKVIQKARMGRFRSFLDRLMRHPVTDILIMILIIVSVVLFAIEAYGLVNGQALKAIKIAGTVITLFFVVELSIRWYTSPSTRRHFQEFWLDWLAVLPVLRPFRILRILRIIRLLRLYRFGAMAQRFIAKTDKYKFEEILRNEIIHYRGKFADQVWLVPDLYRMFSNLLEDSRVDSESRHLITAALAYFITPFDLFPEEIYGAEGYLDQAFICLWVISRLQDELPEHVISEAWEGEGEISGIVSEELAGLKETVSNEGAEQIYRYLGLTANPGVIEHLIRE
jgi:uncharacterized membrane protein YkvA (DUF1232 family)